MVPGKKIFYKLEKIYSPIEWELSEVRKNLNSLKNNFKEACYSITDYTLSSEGKLLRPALLIFFFYLTKKGKFRHTSEKISDLIKLATGIELLHLPTPLG
jgi:geranylgeranyl pyrophosphate synthase